MQGSKLAEVRPPDTNLLKAAITNEIAGNPWHRIKETCERLDLASIPNEESLNKPSYVSARLEATPAERYFDIAMRLYQERPDPELRRAIVPFLPKEIKPATRRQIIEEFAHLQSIRGQGLHGSFSPSAFLERVGGQPSFNELLSSLLSAGRDSSDVIPQLSILVEETDETFLEFLRVVFHPTTRFQRGQQQQNLLFLGELVQAANKYLPAAGYEIKKTGTRGSEPLFEPVAVKVNTEEVRCLIFAAAQEKPDIRIADVLSLDIEVRRRLASRYLVYQTPITQEGLRWEQLTAWWMTQSGEIGDSDARALYKRLAGGLQSHAEQHFFYAYCKRHPISQDAHPALLPQFYLRWDPFTGRQVRAPQRYDFLMLLPKGIRVVIEIDGVQHYAIKDQSGHYSLSQETYAKTVADTRDLILAGYEVHRFGTSELDSKQSAERVADNFFDRLFQAHNIQ